MPLSHSASLVEKTDHHCTWLNTCVGAKVQTLSTVLRAASHYYYQNYLAFFAFVVSGVLCASLAVAASIFHIVLARDARLNGRWLQGWEEIGSLVVGILALAILIPKVGLLGYHLRYSLASLLQPQSNEIYRLVWMGKTTIEMVSHQAIFLDLKLTSAIFAATASSRAERA